MGGVSVAVAMGGWDANGGGGTGAKGAPGGGSGGVGGIGGGSMAEEWSRSMG